MPGWNFWKQILTVCLDGYWKNAQLAGPLILFHPIAACKALFYAMGLLLTGSACLAYAVVWSIVFAVSIFLKMLFLLVAWIVSLAVWILKALCAKRKGQDVPTKPALRFSGILPERDSSRSGLEYEEYVAGRLRKEKYRHVQVTQGSGDFGADILASDPWGNSICIQCKYYAGKVGIHAVQEIAAAQQYYGTSRAMVITNSEFTSAAEKLADQTGVELVERFL